MVAPLVILRCLWLIALIPIRLTIVLPSPRPVLAALVAAAVSMLISSWLIARIAFPSMRPSRCAFPWMRAFSRIMLLPLPFVLRSPPHPPFMLPSVSFNRRRRIPVHRAHCPGSVAKLTFVAIQACTLLSTATTTTPTVIAMGAALLDNAPMLVAEPLSGRPISVRTVQIWNQRLRVQICKEKRTEFRAPVSRPFVPIVADSRRCTLQSEWLILWLIASCTAFTLVGHNCHRLRCVTSTRK